MFSFTFLTSGFHLIIVTFWYKMDILSFLQQQEGDGVKIYAIYISPTLQVFPEALSCNFCFYLIVCLCVWPALESCLTVSLWTVTTRLFCPWDSPDKDTEVGYHALLQGIFPNPLLWDTCITCIFFTARSPGEPSILLSRIKSCGDPYLLWSRKSSQV